MFSWLWINKFDKKMTSHSPLTSQAYKRVVLNAFHLMLVVESPSTSFEVKMGLICMILKHGRWTILRRGGGGNRHEQPSSFLNYNNWRKRCTRKCCVLSSQEDLWPNKFILKVSWMLLWSTRWEQLNSWAPPQILMPKCVNHIRLATLHLECVNCLIF